jgi:hypothetical protein
VTTFIGDTDVSDRPIRMFHGISDDYVQIGPCRNYLARLQTSAKDIKMTEFPDAWHAYDFPNLPLVPTVVEDSQTTHCILKEEPIGLIKNVDTQKPFDQNGDSCVGRNAHVAYSPTVTHATEDAVKALLKTVFKLN